MSIRDQLKTLMWQHGVENDAVLDALDWKVKRLLAQWSAAAEIGKPMDDRRYQYTTAQYETLLATCREITADNDQLREALTSANETIVKLSQNFSIESDRLRGALAPLAALNLPKDARYDTGNYVLHHSDIKRARAALAKEAGQ